MTRNKNFPSIKREHSFSSYTPGRAISSVNVDGLLPRLAVGPGIGLDRPVLTRLIPFIFIAVCAVASPGPESTPDSDPQIAPGAEVYELNCAVCHYDGSGNPAAPDLAGSGFWKNPPEKLAGIILRGQSRVAIVDGRLFGGVMPAMPSLSDEEIAAVAAYVYSTFGDRPVRVDPAMVESVRKEVASGR